MRRMTAEWPVAVSAPAGFPRASCGVIDNAVHRAARKATGIIENARVFAVQSPWHMGTLLEVAVDFTGMTDEDGVAVFPTVLHAEAVTVQLAERVRGTDPLWPRRTQGRSDDIAATTEAPRKSPSSFSARLS